jgi:hypothetical protein
MRSPTYRAALDGGVVRLTLLPMAEWRDSEIGNTPMIVSDPGLPGNAKDAIRSAMQQLLFELSAGEPPQMWDVPVVQG